MNASLDSVRAAFGGYRYRCTNEDELQQALATALERAAIDFRREHRLDARNRVDFWLDGGLVIEVKTKGGASSLLRQLDRYAADDRVSALIVVTTSIRLARATASVESLRDKPVSVIHLPRTW